MTLNDALILSYIKRGIGYGYNILSHVKESGSDEWVDFSRAGLYKTLDKLEKKGLVNKKLVRDQDRPAKKVYSITDDGEKELDAFIENEFSFEADWVDTMIDEGLIEEFDADPMFEGPFKAQMVKASDRMPEKDGQYLLITDHKAETGEVMWWTIKVVNYDTFSYNIDEQKWEAINIIDQHIIYWMEVLEE